jgi:outer membrane protein
MLAAAIAMTGATAANAYEAGDIMVKAGVIHVAPKSDNLELGGSTLEVASDTQLGLTATYMVTPQVGVEVLAATPFKHQIEIDGDKVGTTKHLPPTVSVQYYPMDAASALQPYVGAGLNMTLFFEEEGAAKGNAAGPLGDSFGLSVSGGVNYQIDENLMANLAVWYIDIDSELDALEETVEIDPLVVMVGAGYKF